jgi:hypothetical protein
LRISREEDDNTTKSRATKKEEEMYKEAKYNLQNLSERES